MISAAKDVVQPYKTVMQDKEFTIIITSHGQIVKWPQCSKTTGERQYVCSVSCVK